MKYQFLNRIKSPDDVKKLNKSEIETLCKEIRYCILDTVGKNGGHLASNLGTVELTIAIHRVFNSPTDAIIFDVGHQSYTHKLLTGRFDKFSTLRQENGISGFMRPDESEHDPFITGHSSNSVSAAFGIYTAKRLKGEEGTAIAVIGDGALTGGLAYEALNNVGSGKNNLIVILNDNKMSISKNVGALSRSLTKMRNKPKYHKFKNTVGRILEKIPFIGKNIYHFIFKIKEAIKSLIYNKNVFSSLGFNYLGPVDGHNIEEIESLLRIAENYNRPSLVHVITTKGKGYSYAEEKPKDYHGVAPFDTYEGIAANKDDNFSNTAGKSLCDLAESNQKVCAVTAAMTSGTGLIEFSKRFKNRFFDVGIAEAHGVTFCSGLAKEGIIPYFVVYSTFLQRAYDQLIHDSAIGNMPIKLLIDRAGIVGSDGETHQGIFDVSFLTNIPNIEIYSPSTYEELDYRIKGIAENNKISAIRYPRGSQKECLPFDYKNDFSHIIGSGKTAIITYGRLYSTICKVKEKIENIDIIKLNKIYPFNDLLIDSIMRFDNIYFYEESIKNGSIAEHLLYELNCKGFKGKIFIKAINDFVPTGEVDSLLDKFDLSFKKIYENIEKQVF